jgi:hypothetical protein
MLSKSRSLVPSCSLRRRASSAIFSASIYHGQRPGYVNLLVDLPSLASIPASLLRAAPLAHLVGLFVR